MLIDSFNQTIDRWIAALDGYSFTQLCAKPSAQGWSVGQLYIHLVQDTTFYLEQLRESLASDCHTQQSASDQALVMLRNNAFPDIIIEGHPDNALIPQPESKDELLRGLEHVKREANDLAQGMAQGTVCGKSLHPGFQYLNANEWLQLAEMHLRHHFRQKERLDQFLKSDQVL